MSLQIYINGSFYDKENAKISVFDHGLLYGDGIFEGLRTYKGKVFRLKEHMDRLWDSAKSIALEIPISKEEFADAINKTVAVNKVSEGYVRAIVTRGIGDLGLDADKCVNPCVIIIADNLSLYPKELYEKGLTIVTASTVRTSAAALNPRIKSLNYLNNILAKIEATQSGCIEALLLNDKGEVAECSGDNIFLIKGGVILTPPPEAGILKGITRDAVIEVARKNGIEVHEKTLTRHDVYTADECFLTGSAAELIPVVSIDMRTIGEGKPGPMTAKLHELFHKLATS